MKIGLISGIHGNKGLLENTLTILNNESVDRTYCLGNILLENGRGQDYRPTECIDLMKKEGVIFFLGEQEQRIRGWGTGNPHTQWLTLPIGCLRYMLSHSVPEEEDLYFMGHFIQEGPTSISNRTQAQELMERSDDIAPFSSHFITGNERVSSLYVFSAALRLIEEKRGKGIREYRMNRNNYHVFSLGPITNHEFAILEKEDLILKVKRF